MIAAPMLAPGWFPATGFDGTSARAIWLVLMGIVQAGIGSSYLIARWVIPVMRHVAAYRPQLPHLQPQGSNLPEGVQGSVV